MHLGERLARRVLRPEERDLGVPMPGEQAHELPAGIAGRPQHRDPSDLFVIVHKYARDGYS